MFCFECSILWKLNRSRSEWSGTVCIAFPGQVCWSEGLVFVANLGKSEIFSEKEKICMLCTRWRPWRIYTKKCNQSGKEKTNETKATACRQVNNYQAEQTNYCRRYKMYIKLSGQRYKHTWPKANSKLNSTSHCASGVTHNWLHYFILCAFYGRIFPSCH